MNYGKIIAKAGRYVETYFLENHRPELTYHNLSHTRYVVAAVEKMAAYYALGEEDTGMLTLAAWFHDIGYVSGKNGHEQVSCRLATDFLRKQDVSVEAIEVIRKLIAVTCRTVAPEGLPEEIMLDADTFHLARKSFFKKSELLRKESELLEGRQIARSAWYGETIAFLEQHQYYSRYGKIILEEQKQENLFHLKALSVQHNRHINYMPSGGLSKGNLKAEKSIDTVFKLASENNQRLSSLADSKAHILITVNSIILSAIISLVLRKLQDNEYLIIPTFILLSISLLTMVLAIITTRPTVTRGRFSRGELEQKKANLLFFGNYYKMLPEEYVSRMWMMLEDKVYIYNSVMLDIYYQGTVIGRKYYYLRIAYNIFMWGLVVAVLAFFAAALIFNAMAPDVSAHAG